MGNELVIKKAVMTGAVGPIGMALLRLLLNHNIEVLVFQREASPRRYLLPNNPLLKVEYYDLEHITEYVPDATDYDAFFHLGWANTYIDDRNRLDKQIVNVQYTCNAVEVANKLGCKVFVGVGSQAEYGRKNLPLTHDMVCEPETPYGIMKVCASYSSQLLCKQYGIRHVWARVLSVYGYFDNAFSVIISSITNYIENKEMNYTSGEQIWDFLFVDDLAEALYLLALKGKDGKKYPIGSGDTIMLREYIEKIGNVLECKEDMNFGVIPDRPNGTTYLVADITEVTKDIGWKPKTEFEDGIRKTLPFYQMWIQRGDGIYKLRETGEVISKQGVVWDSIKVCKG